MMYLIVKICTDHSHYSCGCIASQGLVDPPSSLETPKYSSPIKLEASNLIVEQVTLSHNEIDRLDTGSPLRLSRPMIKRRGKAACSILFASHDYLWKLINRITLHPFTIGCEVNSAFADTFTKIFFDADDLRSLNKASKILNEGHDPTKSKRKRYPDVDHRDLSLIKWTKSAVNLHNNHVGRQVWSPFYWQNINRYSNLRR